MNKEVSTKTIIGIVGGIATVAVVAVVIVMATNNRPKTAAELGIGKPVKVGEGFVKGGPDAYQPPAGK